MTGTHRMTGTASKTGACEAKGGAGMTARIALLACLVLPAAMAGSTEVGVIGLFPGKAVLVIDGASPKTYAVGKPVTDGVRLLAVDDEAATLSVNGKKLVIAIGSHVNRITPGETESVTIQADGQGHYTTLGQINGGSIRMLVDTGATMIALPSADAVRLGIDYRRGQPSTVSTANGTARAFRVKLDSVRIGDLQLTQVDALVQENGLPFALLGMSFLGRTDMNRSGSQMTLTKRF